MTSGADRRCSLAALLAFVMPLGMLLSLVVPLATPARAADGPREPAWSVERLMHELAQVKSAKATFVERKHLRVLTAPLESSGTLVYAAPGYLEKHTLAPKPESLVLEKDTLTLEDRTRNRRRTLRLHDYPALWVFVEGLRSTLAGDLETLNRLFRVALEGREADWRLTLDPREPDVQRLVTRIRVAGSRAAIRSIEVEEAQGDRSVMTLAEAK